MIVRDGRAGPRTTLAEQTFHEESKNSNNAWKVPCSWPMEPWARCCLRLPASALFRRTERLAAGSGFRVHQAYIQAGAQIIETNTFGANRSKLAPLGLGDRWQRSIIAA